MPRRRRRDYPGAIHHVMNQGNGQRPIFESRRDIRYFLSLVARRVRRGDIEVISYVIMTTHFHLVLRSRQGQISRSLQWIESMYARYFNRTREKHGGAYRGRFRSKLVESRAYFRVLIWYVDRNPVDAGMTRSPALYPYGSAWHYVRRRGPPWLQRTTVESMVCAIAGTAQYDPTEYVRVMCARESAGRRELIERAANSSKDAPLESIDDLVGAAPSHVQAWLARNAANADGCGTRRLVVSTIAVRSCVAAAAQVAGERTIRLTRKRRSFWVALEAGLLHGAAGCTLQAVAGIQEVSLASAQSRVRAHLAAVRTDAEYGATAAAVLGAAIREDFGPPGR